MLDWTCLIQQRQSGIDFFGTELKTKFPQRKLTLR